MKISLRLGATLWFVGATAALLAIFSFFVIAEVRRSLEAALDDRLVGQSQALAALCEWEEDIPGIVLEGAEDDGRRLPPILGEARFEILALPGMELVHRQGRALPPTSFDGEGNLMNVDDEDRQLRIFVGRSSIPPERGDRGEPDAPGFEVLLRVGADLHEVDDAVSRIAVRIVVLCLLSLALIVGLGAFLARRLVRPIVALDAAAASIEKGERSKMPIRGVSDEVDGLAETLDRAFASLQEALESQRRFTANAAHELRNPLAVIRNAASMASREERDEEDVRVLLADIEETSKRMGGIVEALLVLARLDAGAARARFESVDVAAMISELAATRGVEISVSGEGHVDADPDLMRMMLGNVLDNAVRHDRSNERIEVAIEPIEHERLRITMRDHGPGMTDEECARATQAFFRAEGATVSRDGAGLGLAIVNAIARLHGGTCRLSPAKPGLSVAIDLPIDAVGG